MPATAAPQESESLRAAKEKRAEIRTEIKLCERSIGELTTEHIALMEAEEPNQERIDYVEEKIKEKETELEALQKKEASYTTNVERLERLTPKVPIDDPSEELEEETEDDSAEFSTGKQVTTSRRICRTSIATH